MTDSTKIFKFSKVIDKYNQPRDQGVKKLSHNLKHVSDFLDDDEKSSLAQSSRSFEKYRKRTNSINGTVDLCRKHGSYKYTRPCRSSVVYNEGFRCCRDLYLVVNRESTNLTFVKNKIHNFLKNYHDNKQTLQQAFNYLSNDRYISGTISDYIYSYYLDKRKYYGKWGADGELFVIRKNDLQEAEKYHQYRQQKDHELQLFTIKKNYLGIELDLSAKTSDYLDYFIKNNENHVVWRDFISPVFGFFLPKTTDLIINNPGNWPREMWCLYLAFILFETKDKYLHIVNYANNNFIKLFDYIDKNLIDIKKIIHKSNIPSPTSGFIYKEVPKYFILDMGDQSNEDQWSESYEEPAEEKDEEDLYQDQLDKHELTSLKKERIKALKEEESKYRHLYDSDEDRYYKYDNSPEREKEISQFYNYQ